MADNAVNLVVKLRSIDSLSNSLKKINEAVGDTNKKLRDLERTQKQINGFKDLQGASAKTAKSIEDASKKVKDLRQQLIAAENPSKALKREYSQSTRELKSLQQQQTKQNQALNDTRIKMQEAGIPINRLNSYERELSNSIKQTTIQL